ncbi:C-_U-editing enzyme APOBEC-1-like [Camarhynchus parvulus]|uniref:C->U-editing enzyme APOBEC-1-like n=1 Tax=Geospiza parvula TaxID=87175 RepID=UPI001237B9A0|nr:C->U-editing enzyme APOBEC-1-like [Camarhynchus parvulus]
MYRRKMRGMYISKRALRKHFDPREFPMETYLMCELWWHGGMRSWRHWVRNDDYNNCHAEQYFLEEIFEPRSYNICDMYWYLSYSPCSECCDVIRDFLEEQPNVNIYIHVARLYRINDQENCEALRKLNSLQEVTIKAMEAEDYNYCRKTFIQRGVDCDFSPKKFQSEIQRNRVKLDDILQAGRQNKFQSSKPRGYKVCILSCFFLGTKVENKVFETHFHKQIQLVPGEGSREGA